MDKNNLTIGIVGLPNIGKSALFNALTKKFVPSENFPFCTIDPSFGSVMVPDKRLDKLSSISNSKIIINTSVVFVDIAGLVKGASQGEGLGNEFLSHIRGVDVILHLLRGFEDKKVTHVNGDINPVSDIETINTELVLSDLEIINKRIKKLEKDVRQKIKEAIKENEVLLKAYDILKEGTLLYKNITNEDEISILNKNGILTVKPMFFVLNTCFQNSTLIEKTEKYLNSQGFKLLKINVAEEEGLALLSEDLVEEVLLEEKISCFDEIIKTSYSLLNLITFFTTGIEETRAWSCKKFSTAPQAGSVIHTDFEEKFIRAEVVSYNEFVKHDGYTRARENGVVRIEGKVYIVQDGDIIVFKI